MIAVADYVLAVLGVFAGIGLLAIGFLIYLGTAMGDTTGTAPFPKGGCLSALAGIALIVWLVGALITGSWLW